MSLLYGPTGEPIEIAVDRGDLRFGSQPFNPWLGGLGELGLIGGRTISFAELFATQPWVGGAVMRMLTWAVRVPLKAYRRTGDDSRKRLRPGDHPVADAIVEPWPRGSQASLTMSLLGPLLVHGNSITRIREARNELRFDWDPIDWRLAVPNLKDGELLGWRVRHPNGTQEELTAPEVLHIAWWSPCGPLGVSPLQQLGVTLRIEDAAQRYQESLFLHGARPPSAVVADKEFLGWEPEKREKILANLREDVTKLYAGPENSGRPALLPPGLDWKPVGHTAVEAELIDQRKVAREEICGVYQIPPPLLGILDRGTFNNYETAREIGYTDSLGPPLVLIEQSINAHVIRGILGETDVYVEYDFGGVLRGDRLKEMQALREAISYAVMSPNDARSTLNLPRVDAPGMDAYYLPQNNLGRVDTNSDSDSDSDEGGNTDD